MCASCGYELTDIVRSTTELPRQPSSADRVFRIPELLETILLSLPTKDLLLSQRTSRTFHQTIQGSFRLRRKLFLEPEWNLEGRLSDAWSNNNRPGRKPENNRLLLRAFPGSYPTITLVIMNDGTTAEQGQMTISNGQAGIKRGSEQWSWDVCISFRAGQKPNLSPAVDYPEASWRKMYLSQPPCTNLHLVRRWQRSLEPAIVRPGGVTMGDFFDEVTKDIPGCDNRKWQNSYISSDGDWHFEGNLRCSTVQETVDSSQEDQRKHHKRLATEYAFSRTLLNGRVRALSDDWDPGHTVEFAARPATQ